MITGAAAAAALGVSRPLDALGQNAAPVRAFRGAPRDAEGGSRTMRAVYTANSLSGDGISIDVEYIPSGRIGLRGPG